jgi:hypothetical protein
MLGKGSECRNLLGVDWGDSDKGGFMQEFAIAIVLCIGNYAKTSVN